MQSVSRRKLGLVVDTVWLHETLDVSERLVYFISDFVHECEVGSARVELELSDGLRGRKSRSEPRSKCPF